MAMRVFKSHFDFYKLPEKERQQLVGDFFIEEGREHYKKGEEDRLFFPLSLHEDEFNYGKQQGLIFVSEVRQVKGESWFRVGVSSPDDLDMDLDFQGIGFNFEKLRLDVVEYVKQMSKQNVKYRDFLRNIQEHFNAGEMTS